MKHLKLKKHTLNLVDGDWDELRRLFPEIDTSEVVREVIHRFVERERLKAPVAKAIKLKDLSL